MKVRIGNDICLHVSLLGDNTTDYVNIKTIRAYLINTSRQKEIDEEHRIDTIQYRDDIERRNGTVKYISRFPAEPFHHAYHGTPYDLCHSGHPTYHVHPIYAVAPYIGFGVHPHTFDPFHNHLWGYDDMMDVHDRMLRKDRDYVEKYDKCEFLAPVQATDKSNKVLVYFPAENQLYTGTYKLVIVAQLYQPGYSPNNDNLRTVTMDYNEVFVLVKDSEEGAAGDINITIGNSVKVQLVELAGDSTIFEHGSGSLTATVFPTNVDKDTVTWEIIDATNSVHDAYSDGHKITFRHDGTMTGESLTFVVKATSVKDPQIFATKTITVVKGSNQDKYLVRTYASTDGVGNEKKSYLNFEVSGVDQPLQIETTKETVWYEGQ